MTPQQTFTTNLNKLAYTKGIRDAFTDMLDTALSALIVYDHANLRRTPIDTYSDQERTYMVELVKAAGDICDGDGTGFVDAFGDLFMEHLSFGRNGQFFTPQPICDLMAEIQDKPEDGQTVCDPACGSGRTLLAMAKRNRNLRFYGSDIDLTCVKMAALNMALNSLRGEIAWMDTIRMEHWGSFNIYVEPFSRVPYIVTTPPGVTSFIPKKQPEPTPVPDPEPEPVNIPAPPPQSKPFEQLKLF